jgi:RNA polymerase sigma factor (sigma-70 family)
VDEKLLINSLKNAEPEAFKILVESYKNKVYITSLGILQNPEDAEDAAQEVFLEVYLSIKHFKEQSKLSTWIYRITVSKSLELLRRKKRKKRFGFITSIFGESDKLKHDPPDFIHPGVQAENKELSSILFKAISKLPESQNIAYTLHNIEGLSYQDIAEVMETSVSSIESLIFRAKNNLKKLLTSYYQQLK